VKTRELADLERLHSRLELRLPVSAESAILHGDYRIDNLILDPGDRGTGPYCPRLGALCAR